jgi:formate-dependent nitrite reductase membrane component NrfD
MQACPYDALYIDPDHNTAAKCNFDASRIEMGYKPACEVVCPTQAILSGDLDDPNSELNRRIGTEKVNVRKPEKGTKPKLFYIGVEGDLLQPTMMDPQPTHLWAEKQPAEDLYALNSETFNGAVPGGGREIYDVSHIRPGGNKIASYLWTKSISAGILALSALFLNIGFEQDAWVLYFVSPVVSLVFLTATMLLLIFDLKRPDRFLYLLTKPNLKSWLVLGGYVLITYGVLALTWLLYGIITGSVPPLIFWPTALFGLASAGYSAFLFAQARGRDFWQSPLLFWHLLVQAITAGAAMLSLIGYAVGVTVLLSEWLGFVLVLSLVVGLAMILTELFMTHSSEAVARSAALLTKGALRRPFWFVVVGLGVLGPVALIVWFGAAFPFDMIGAVLALVGLWMYENLWIKAGQSVPLS